MPDQSPPEPRLSLWQMMQSVAWSFFGVQSHANRVRDFSRGRAWPFIVVALAMTLGVILLFSGAVKLTLYLGGVR